MIRSTIVEAPSSLSPVVGPAPTERTTRARSEGSSVEDLVRRAQAGSSTAFGELVERFESPLFNFVLRRVPNREDAEDLAQETFVRAWRKLDRYDARWTFGAWLFTLARRLAATRLRLAHPAPDGNEVLVTLPVHADPGLDLAQSEERVNLWSIADRVLEEDPRCALWLRYAEGLEIREIARILGRSSVSVRVMLFRARGRLGRFLGPVPRGSPVDPRAPETVRFKEAEV